MRIDGDAFVELRHFKESSFDLVLTDPPYNFKEEEKKKILGLMKYVSRQQVILFCDARNQWPQSDQYLFWIKPSSTKNPTLNYPSTVEVIQVYGVRKFPKDIHWHQRNSNVFHDLVDKSVHDYRKPPSLIERLITMHSNEGDHILDPFAGSHVVEEVCKKLGRKCTSIEIQAAGL
ncbi:site-specific DNA-methyltransferase [Candidatus Pacearchaeota archaeon]|nr:site-specific DNA-methyltransferase [Candidatus Pacearchaeota archaeon]